MKNVDHTPIHEETDRFLTQYALHLWINYIETGDPTLSALDAQQAKKPFKALHVDQMKLVIRLRDLAAKNS